MSPNWLTTRSNVPGAKVWVWASATTNSTLSIRAVEARSDATSVSGVEMSIPTAESAKRAAARVSAPHPQPTSSND